MNNRKPVISIIVPAYNAEPYIEQCLDSLVNQTLADIEIILLNDGSTDNTGQICDGYAEKDNRIKLIHKENTGLSDTRNKGIELATGEYIMFVDADDWIKSNTCELVCKKIIQTDVDILFWSYIREYENYSYKKKINLQPGLYKGIELKYYIQRRMIGLLENELAFPENADAISTVWGKIYKQNILLKNKVQFIDTKIIGTEDALFNLHACEFARNAFFLNEHLYHYRKNNHSSLTKTYKSWLFDRWQNLYHYMQLFIIENSLPEYYNTALNNRRCLSIIGLGLTEVDSSNKKNSFQKIKFVTSVLNHPDYAKAYKHLNLKYFIKRPHWFLFFFFCKIRFSVGVYSLLLLMKHLKRRI